MRAFRGEALGDRGADARAGTGDERVFACESLHKRSHARVMTASAAGRQSPNIAATGDAVLAWVAAFLRSRCRSSRPKYRRVSSSASNREVRPAPLPRHVLNERGGLERVPDDWELLPPGDPALSRRIKQAGPTLTVIEIKGRKRFSQGIWAPAAAIHALRAELALERADPAYQRKLDAGRRRREEAQVDYELEFRAAVFGYLAFHPRHEQLARTLANLITEHATPVGSGTVARTERIPLDERAEAATIAWLRHQTTGYDSMHIPREKGRRREVRRMLAQRSVQLLAKYRSGERFDPAQCPLQRALAPHLAARTLG